MKTSWLNTNDSFKARMIGKLLGDGSITIQQRRKPRFQFTHKSSDCNWSNYCYSNLKEFIPLNPPKYQKTVDLRLKKGYSTAYRVQSKTSNIITYLRKKWYSEFGKVIPIDLMEEYFNEESLAWWYMDDGHLKHKDGILKKVILSTESFTIDEINWLKNFLHNKYNLTFHKDKQNRLLLYDQFQIHYFLYLITPHMHWSMHRKTINNITYKSKSQIKRTTIYLPTALKIKYPTFEINTVLNILSDIITSYKNGTFYRDYLFTITNKQYLTTKGYQIVLTESNLSNLYFLYNLTGISFSRLATLSFKINTMRSPII
ncbi:endonuclease [Virgibacillus doumboii]|uniref:endonuclease n=1 Tax=Virgibacillus doumboii TaxID=2697503 RepID=UPI0013DE8E7E|nr:endonuclease [Virgibacillus doumboii]